MLDVDQMDELVLLNTLSRPPVLVLLTSLREAEEGHRQQEESHAASHLTHQTLRSGSQSEAGVSSA